MRALIIGIGLLASLTAASCASPASKAERERARQALMTEQERNESLRSALHELERKLVVEDNEIKVAELEGQAARLAVKVQESDQRLQELGTELGKKERKVQDERDQSARDTVGLGLAIASIFGIGLKG